MRRSALSGEQKSIDSILDWYRFHDRVLRVHRAEVLRQLATNDVHIDRLFATMDAQEIERFFGEIDYLVMLDLLAATEAAVRVDFLTRVGDRRKDEVSRHFRRLAKNWGLRIGLEQHILGAWRDKLPQAKPAISDFKGAWAFRHWLAHGRYRARRFGRADYSPDDIYDIYDICSNLLHALSIRP